jgi:hypothetical protein
VVGGADVDIWQGVGAVQKFSGRAEIWDWLPDEEGFRTAGVEGFSTTENGGYEVDTAGWGAV